MKLSEYLTAAVKFAIQKQMHINKMIFIYLMKKHEISSRKIFLHRIFCWNFIICVFLASMVPNIEHPCMYRFFKIQDGSMFSDKAKFYGDSQVYRQNCHYWPNE